MEEHLDLIRNALRAEMGKKKKTRRRRAILLNNRIEQSFRKSKWITNHINLWKIPTDLAEGRCRVAYAGILIHICRGIDTCRNTRDTSTNNLFLKDFRN